MQMPRIKIGAGKLVRSFGAGIAAAGGAVGRLIWKFRRGRHIKNPYAPAGQEKESDRMGLRHVFWGAALVGGALMAPGAYYMTQENEIVRTRVTGKVQADADAEYPGRKYFIYTNQGKFDTYAVSNGGAIREGCVYDFNLKSARLQWWPPSYSRSIKSYKHVPGSGCAPD